MPKPVDQIRKNEAQIPQLQMRAAIQANSVNAEKRTAELVWTTGEKGLRSPWFGEAYMEELSLAPECVRMGRLQSGAAPLLDSHQTDELDDVIGVVDSATLSATEGRCIVRFASDPDSEVIFQKVRDGILKNVSVGYRVYKYERQPLADGEQIPTYLAVDWEPCEVSMVAVGFDSGAGVRSREGERMQCQVINNVAKKRGEEEVTMPPEIETPVQSPSPVPAVDVNAVRSETVASERKRLADISVACRAAKVDEKRMGELLAGTHSADQVRELLINELAEKDAVIHTRSPAAAATGGLPAEIAGRRAGLENAMLHRAQPGKIQLSTEGRHFRGMTLLDMARDTLAAGGVNVRGLSKMELATRAFHSASDFPEVLANVAHKTLRRGYEEAPRTFLGWAKEAQLPDFKQVSRVSLGGAPTLEVVGEDGEIKRGTIGDAAEKYQLATYAKILGISRAVVINDDLAAFADIPSKFGYAAASLESDVVYAILTANAALSDGVTLFHSSHANSGTGGVPSITTLGEMRKLLRLMTGIEGRILNIQLKYLIGPAALESVFDQLVVLQTNPAQDSNANPFKGKLVPVVEPRLDANSAVKFYGACDPSQCDTVEYGYLEGQQGVYSETRMGFDVDGIEIKARLDFAAKALDYRGLVYNAGA